MVEALGFTAYAAAAAALGWVVTGRVAWYWVEGGCDPERSNERLTGMAVAVGLMAGCLCGAAWPLVASVWVARQSARRYGLTLATFVYTPPGTRVRIREQRRERLEREVLRDGGS